MSHDAQVITSRQHPLVGRFRALARGADEGMLLDGPHLTRDAIAAGIVLEVAAVAREALVRPEIAAIVKTLPADRVVTVTESVLDAMSPSRTPTGIVAIAARPQRVPADVIKASNPLVLVAVAVQDPGNLGAMIRAGEAGGGTGFIAAGASADPFGWKALRGAMGSALRLPVIHMSDLDSALNLVRTAGLRSVGTAPAGGVPMDAVDLTGPVALILGGEGAGLPPDRLRATDVQITIPMAPPVESLNVAVATALLVYAARRQRLAASPSASTV
jgi:RNA methyltransferase, TrmH family